MTFLYDVPEADYHKGVHDGEVPRLTQSVAKILLERSPLHAYHYHPSLGGKSRPVTKAMDRGTLIHAALLGTGPEIVVVNYDNWRTNDAKAQRDEAREVGRLPVLAKEFEPVMEAAEIIRGRLADRGFALDGKSEVSMYWQETATGGASAQARGRLDHKPASKSFVVYDIKTTNDASPDGLRSHVFRFGGDIQAAAYLSALEKEWGEEGQWSFYSIYIEQEPPYGIVPVKLSGHYLEIGRRRWQKAIDIWSECVRANEWPDYNNSQPVNLEPPAWVVEQAEAMTLEVEG